MIERLTPELLLSAYAAGIFPMAEGREQTEVHWVDPQKRGVFPLDGFQISRSLSRRIGRVDYDVRINTAFENVVQCCADRPETWINKTIFDLYVALHKTGFAHCLEIWNKEALVGGVYGITLGRAFFGESMFSHRRDASKVALAWLIHRLRSGGFTLFDTQFLTPHLASLGAIEISREDYHQRLSEALKGHADFDPAGYAPAHQSVRQRKIQTS